jgi:hypothetical protein
MRENPLKQKLLKGQHAFGARAFEFFTPGLPQSCGPLERSF